VLSSIDGAQDLMKPCVAMLMFLGALPASSQVIAGVDNPARELTAAGSKLKHFAPVDVGVYKGSRPKSDADYRFLQSLHVRYIVDLQVFPFMSFLEKRKARKYGITVIPGIMNASPISPSEKHVDAILTILRDEKYHPIYFHCRFGRDRTSVIAALYRMYFLGMSPQDATQYLHESGYAFRFGWLRSGLTRYVKKHPTPSTGLLSASETR
jgi:protein tyrosine/serine phosphatase